MKWSSYCTIALISHPSKMMLKILQARLQHFVNHELPDVQAGFIKGRGSRDQIPNMRWIIEKARVPEKCLLLLYWLHQSLWLCSFQSLRCLDSATLQTAADQASLSITKPWVYSNSCPLSRWCHPTISSSVIPLSSHLQSFPASGSFLMSQFFISSGQSIAASASVSVLPMNIHDWSPLGWTGLYLLAVQGTLKSLVQHHSSKHQFSGAQFSYGPTLISIHDYWKNHRFD